MGTGKLNAGGNLEGAGGGEIEILLVASCYKNRDKLYLSVCRPLPFTRYLENQVSIFLAFFFHEYFAYYAKRTYSTCHAVIANSLVLIR